MGSMSKIILGEKYKKLAVKTREDLIKTIDTKNLDNTIKILESKGFTLIKIENVSKSVTKVLFRNKDLEFIITERLKKVTVGRTVTMRLDDVKSDAETLQAMKDFPYRYIILDGNVYIKNYDWTKESKIKQ